MLGLGTVKRHVGQTAPVAKERQAVRPAPNNFSNLSESWRLVLDLQQARPSNERSGAPLPILKKRAQFWCEK